MLQTFPPRTTGTAILLENGYDLSGRERFRLFLVENGHDLSNVDFSWARERRNRRDSHRAARSVVRAGESSLRGTGCEGCVLLSSRTPYGTRSIAACETAVKKFRVHRELNRERSRESYRERSRAQFNRAFNHAQ